MKPFGAVLWLAILLVFVFVAGYLNGYGRRKAYVELCDPVYRLVGGADFDNHLFTTDRHEVYELTGGEVLVPGKAVTNAWVIEGVLGCVQRTDIKTALNAIGSIKAQAVRSER